MSLKEIRERAFVFQTLYCAEDIAEMKGDRRELIALLDEAKSELSIAANILAARSLTGIDPWTEESRVRSAEFREFIAKLEDK